MKDSNNILSCCVKLIVSGAALVALAYLNLNRCNLPDEGCDKFSGE